MRERERERERERGGVNKKNIWSILKKSVYPEGTQVHWYNIFPITRSTGFDR